jgi:hypothetical protein
MYLALSSKHILIRPYEPMVVEGAHWVIREIQSYPLQAQNPTQRAACRYIADDTLLNGVRYKKCIKRR